MLKKYFLVLSFIFFVFSSFLFALFFYSHVLFSLLSLSVILSFFSLALFYHNFFSRNFWKINGVLLLMLTLSFLLFYVFDVDKVKVGPEPRERESAVVDVYYTNTFIPGGPFLSFEIDRVASYSDLYYLCVPGVVGNMLVFLVLANFMLFFRPQRSYLRIISLSFLGVLFALSLLLILVPPLALWIFA